MVSVFIYCHKKKDADILHQLCGYCTALMGNDKLSAVVYNDEMLTSDVKINVVSQKLLQKKITLDIIIFEIAGKGDVKELVKVRDIFPEALLLIITHSSILPESYVNPCFRPIILLVQPYSREKALDVLHQLYTYYYERRERELPMNRLLIRNRAESRYINYKQILFMEAREKKIFLRCGEEEISFYHSLKKMETVLPEYFIRCHRSYIVNFMYISYIDISRSVLCINNDIVIPISKKYKKIIDKLTKEDLHKIL